MFHSVSHKFAKEDRLEKLDEQNRLIQQKSKSIALDFVVTATEILTVMCWVKGNPAWKGCLGVVCFGLAASLFYKFRAYRKRPYAWVSILFGLMGAALFVWFGIAG